MFGVILAAGVGSRLRPITDKKPKCLVRVSGRPILRYQIDAYKNAGIKKLFIVAGYEAQAIHEYCKHIKGVEIEIVDNPDFELTNNMYSLFLLHEQLSGNEFVLSNGDVAIETAVLETLVNEHHQDCVAVDIGIHNDESMKVSVNQNGYIDDISKELTQEQSIGCSIDFYKFSASASDVFFGEIRRIIEVEKNIKDWTEVALQRLFREQRLKFSTCDISSLKWTEIDNYDDLAAAEKLFSGFKSRIRDLVNFVFDLDGTLYVGKKIIPGAIDAIKALRAAGKKIYFVSNNSSKSRGDYVRTLGDYGISCHESEIVLSTDSLVAFLEANQVKKIHVLGTDSLVETLSRFGFDTCSSSPEYVVIGYDTELTYEKLVSACGHINAGVDFLATHSDIFCPSELGPVPDVGAFLEMITATTGKKPTRVFGKPDISMLRTLGIDPALTVVVGDRMYTDIMMARNFGCQSVLVLTGDTTRELVDVADLVADFVVNSVEDLRLAFEP
jgi:HAD superfamily hydrolase (TIGR01450 family)